MKLSNHQKAIIALIIANIIWGAGSPIFKWSLQNVHPFTLAFLRFFLATAILSPFVYKSLSVQKEDIKNIVLMALSGITINISFYFLALEYTSSINAPIIGSSAPIFITLGSLFILKETVKKRMIFGGLIGLFGILLVVLQPLLQKGLDGSVLGNLLLVIATVGGIVHIMIGKKVSKNYNPIVLTLLAFEIGAFSFFPFFAAETIQYGFLPNVDIRGIVGILYGAVFASALAYCLLHMALKYLLTTEAGIFTYIDPLFAIIIAYPLLGEVPTAAYLIGAFFVFLGIYIAEGRIHFHPIHLLRLTEEKLTMLII